MTTAPPSPFAADRGRSWLIAFVIVSAANVLGSALGWSLLSGATKPFIMPLLFIWAGLNLTRPLTRPGIWFLVGIVFAWLGDVLLMGPGDLFFLLGIAGFFGMQVCYIGAYLSVPGQHHLRRWWWVLAPFIAYWAGMNLLLDPGALRVPILLYSIVLVGMSVVAFDLIPRLRQPLGVTVFIGSALFVISDSLIALGAFADLDWGNWNGFLIMATYVVAQFLIVTGFVIGQPRVKA